jgi:uncharacterized protein YgbK (DUF1537 family)
MTLVIIADDLTGAADSAARCHQAGMAAHILLDPPQPPLPDGAIALSSDSRFLPAAEAAQQVRRLLASLPAHSAHWYKKIDSTLRGNLGAEIDAMLAIVTPGGEPPCTVICPAFPAQGRGLQDGELVFKQDAGQRRSLPALLAQQSARPVALLPLATVRSGVEQLAEAMRSAIRQGGQLLVVDSLSDDDLAKVVTATHLVHPHALLCGSAGLIEPLARSLAHPGDRPPVMTLESSQVRPPILAVVGSGSVMAHRQIEALRSLPDVAIIDLTAGQSSRWESQPGEIPPHGWVIHLPQPAAQTVLEGPEARALVTHLAQVASAAVHRLQPATLLLVGGDTALHVLERLGIRQLTVLAELLPGIPLLEGIDAAGTTRRIITKAGNFGDELTLCHLFELT